MKKIFANLLLIAASAVMLASCDNPAKMAEAAEQISIKCTPEVLEAVAGNIDAENDAQYVIKAESSKTIVLDLVASSEKVNVKINDKAVKFVKDEEAASYHATYTMNITAGQEYIITLTSSSKVAYKLSVETAQAVEEKAEEKTEEAEA